MKDRIRIVALGGLDERGKSCYTIDINGDIFVISSGLRFPDRTTPGVDYIIPNFSYLTENKERVKAYFLPHGHDDEIGGLAYLYKEVPAPIYGSKVTLAMMRNFLRHVGVDGSAYDFHEVEPSSTFTVAGREISFFQTSHNIAQSSGIAINTSYGNIVFTSDYVVENNATQNYLGDMASLSAIAEKNPTLALLTPSIYAERPGYTAPKYKLKPLIERQVTNALGRVFIALYSLNFYNIDEVINLAIQTKKKIIPYDDDTTETLRAMQECGQLLIPRENYGSVDDINRYRDQDIIVLMLGYHPKIYHKIALLAAGQTEGGRPIHLKDTDLFISAVPADDNEELEATDALDELYRSGCQVYNITKKEFRKMHASEEDLKMMISLFRPKYYVPVKGFFKDLLNNAKVAMNTGTGLTHNNIFLLENGMSLLFDETGGHILQENIPHGDIMIDGIGVGDVSRAVIEDREKLSQGVVIVSVTVSKVTHKVIAGPDIQARGIVFARDGEVLLRDVTKVFMACLDEGLNNNDSFEEIKELCHERCARTIRRMSGKEPLVIPVIVEI
ncbi:MAG: ribonuclease J [Bacilli bacterium]|nr:ribonuclease J [Bacilli bacterium]